MIKLIKSDQLLFFKTFLSVQLNSVSRWLLRTDIISVEICHLLEIVNFDTFDRHFHKKPDTLEQFECRIHIITIKINARNNFYLR